MSLWKCQLYETSSEGNGIEIYADMMKDWREILNLEHPDRLHSSPWAPGEVPPLEEPQYNPAPEIRRVDGSIFHPRCLGHAALVAEDLDAVLGHYEDIVGLNELFRGPEDSYAVLSGTLHGRDLTIFRAREGQTTGLHHIAFELDDERELDDAEQRMSEAGMQAELKLDHVTKRAIFLKDPDGLLVEFFVDRPGPLSMLGDLEPGLALHLA